MPAPLALPDDLTERPLVPADAAAVTDVIAAQELADVGEVVVELADIVADWQRPGYDVPAHSVGVFEADTLVAFGEVGWITDRGEVAVHPDHRGRGIGTQLERWVREKARELGATEVGMPVPEGSPGDRLLASLGHHVRWTSWVLQLPEGTTIPERPLPEGYAVRAAEESEHEACWTVQEDAFLEWAKRERDTFEEWQASTVLRPGFEPWHLRVVTDAADEVVAMALIQTNGECCYIARLATRKDQRGRGLAQALLVDSFRAGAAHGSPRAELSTDSRTGALGLYEKVGMRTHMVWVNRAIRLGSS
ncbi:MAG: GNAT family N-acetyltransferase [Nocardioides sp.]